MTDFPAPGAPTGGGVYVPRTRSRHNRGTDRILFVFRGIGQTLITAGLVVLLFVVYEVWVSNIFAHWKQEHVASQFNKDIVSGFDPLALPGADQSAIPIGSGIANLYIPRLGPDYHFTIVQGTDEASLDKGPGHYVGTALPGQIGDFAVAGHRVGKGEPFLNLDQLKPGDAIVVQTVHFWYVYRVFGDYSTGNLGVSQAQAPPNSVITSPAPAQALKDGVIGREIVSPEDGAVIQPVPDNPGVVATGALMTMTTCHPKFTANKRMIVHAYLARTIPVSGNSLPSELVGGTL